MDIEHVLSRNPLRPAYGPLPWAANATTGGDGWTEHDGGIVPIGHDGDGFAFDNEGPRHDALLQPFAIADSLVTCGDWLAFIDDGGYRQPGFWLSDGWAMVQAQGWQAPLHWRAEGREFTLHGEQAIDPAAPASHLSFYEAAALAAWAGARLPTEFEWEVAARGLPVEGNFLESGRWRPAADAPDAGAGVPAPHPRQMYGDVWEWTASPYVAYPGFRAAAGAVGEYNGKFMANQFVLRGGSCATPRDHIRASYRNFFPPEACWQFTGIRLARDV